MTGLWVVLGVLLVGSAIGFGLRARDGRIRAARPLAVLPGQVRELLGPGITLVQVSTKFCAPCKQAHTLLSGLVDGVAGLRHVELDVTDQPAVATDLGVMRTPTTLALAEDGTELLRVGGVPRREELLTALQPHLRSAAA